MSKLQELYDQRAKLVADARAEIDKITDDTAEGEVAEIEARFDEMMSDAEKLKGKIDRYAMLDQSERSLEEQAEFRAAKRTIETGKPASKDEERERSITARQAIDRYLRVGREGMSREERAALTAMTVSGSSIGDAGIAEIRAQGVGDANSGAVLVPEEFRRIIDTAMLAYGGMREAATVIDTATGGSMPMPTSNDTAQTGELLAEHATAAAQDIAYGEVILGAYKFSSKVVRVSYELLQDSAIDIVSHVGMQLGTRIGRITNAYFTTGTGTGEPNGIVVAATSGKTAAATNAFTILELQDLVHSVDPAYRAGSRFMLNDAYLKEIAKFTVGTGDVRPVWVPSTRDGEPDRILGYPYVVNQSMASGLTTGTIGVVFGDLSKYVIRNVRDMFLVRLDELYATQGQVGFVAFSRQDGDLLDAGTNPVKYLNLA